MRPRAPPKVETKRGQMRILTLSRKPCSKKNKRNKGNTADPRPVLKRSKRLFSDSWEISTGGAARIIDLSLRCTTKLNLEGRCRSLIDRWGQDPKSFSLQLLKPVVLKVRRFAKLGAPFFFWQDVVGVL